VVALAPAVQAVPEARVVQAMEEPALPTAATPVAVLDLGVVAE